jgi:hypothetical protein
MANRGKSALWPAIEKELMLWVNDRRQQGLSISSESPKCIQNHAGHKRFQSLHRLVLWVFIETVLEPLWVIVVSVGKSNVSGV